MPDETIRICTDIILSGEDAEVAETMAIDEDIRNAGIESDEAGLPGGAIEMSVEIYKLWKNGRSLGVCFLDGDDFQQGKVIEYASLWSRYANISFNFGVAQAQAEIRISFHPKRGSWSAVGTDCLVEKAFPKHLPTMNLAWVTRDYREDQIRQVILHEFGHALVCIHEHQNPAAGIPWDEERAYRYYKETNGWSPAQVQENVFKRYAKDSTQFSAYDPLSIMSYHIPPGLTKDGSTTPENSSLSPTDIAFISSIYSKDAAGD
jgi:hypothetical protein